MSNPVGFEELFNFDDTTPIDQAIKKIEQLSSVYDKLVDQASENSAEYAKAIKEIADSAEQLEKQISSLDATEKKHQETILKAANAADAMLKKNDAYSKSLKAEEQAIIMLTEQQKKLATSKEKLAKVNEAEAGSLDDLKKQLAEATKAYTAMGDATSQAVKDEALAKIKTLSKSVAEADIALKNAKKGVDLAAGSYNELAAKVAEAKKRLKDMEGGIGSNSKQFKELQKFVKDGSDQLKEFDNAMGDNQRKVGDYAGELGKINPVLGGLVSGFGEVQAAATKLLANPIVLTIAAIAASIALLSKAASTFFSESIEGQDKLNELTTYYTATTEVLTDRLEELGGEVVDFFGKAFTDPMAALNDVVDFLFNQIVNRVKAIGGIFVELKDVIAAAFDPSGDVGKELEELNDQVAMLYTGVEGFTAKAKKFMDEVVEKQKIALEIAKLEALIRKEKIKDIVDDAVTELKVNEKLEDSKNKLSKTDEQRFRALKEANRLLREQVEGDLELAQLEIDAQKEVIRLKGGELQANKLLSEYTNDELVAIGVKYEELEKLAQLEEAQIKIQSQAAQKRKALLRQEIQLIQEIEKERAAKIKAEEDAERALQNVLINGRIEANREILADERSTLEERLDALNEIAEEQTLLLQMQREKELNDAKEAALERIQLDEETLSTIYNNEKLSVAERIALVTEAKEAYLESNAEQDKIYLDQVDKTNAEYAQKLDKVNQDTIKAGQDNVFKQWEKDYKNFVNEIDTNAAEETLGLNEAFEQGIISLEEYTRTRARIQQEAQIESLKSQLDYLQKQQEALAAAGYNTTELEKKIAQTRLAISDASNKELLERERQLQQALQDLKNVAYDTALSVIDSFNEAEDIKREERLTKLEENYQNELALAGDNEEKKAELTNAFNAEKKKIEKEQADADRKRAVFEKAVAIFEIGVNTAIGVSKAVAASPLTGGLPFSAIIAAIGALQIAAVLAKPIPSYKFGTEDHPGGLAVVNDDGTGRPEIIKEPGRRPYYIDSKGPVLANIAAHSKVITADRTAQIMSGNAIGDRMVAGFDDDTQKLIAVKKGYDTQVLVNALGKGFGLVDQSIRSKKNPAPDMRGLAREVSKGISEAVFLSKRYE